MIKVLDHGYVHLIETFGHGLAGQPEAGIIEAARQSTQGSFRGWDTDVKLLRHLWRNSHMTPFEFCGLIIEVQAPLFVFREWHRHRTQSYNEMSARYAPLPDVNYMPTQARCVPDASNVGNKQAQGVTDRVPTPEEIEEWKEMVESSYRLAEQAYQRGLKIGIPKEVARIPMPVGRYSRMRAAGNLRNWLHFVQLRSDVNAQWEIRQYSDAVGTLLSQLFPQTWEAFSE